MRGIKKFSQYKEGDFVLIRDTIKPNEVRKLKLKYKSPYKVTYKVLNKNRYIIYHLYNILDFNI